MLGDQYYCVLQSLHKHVPVLLCTTKLAQTRSNTTVYHTACTKHFPVLLCTTKLAQSTSQHLCTTKLAQSTSQYHCVLQSLHKALPSTTVYYKTCTKHFPVPLCTTKLAQTRSSTTVYYKACTNTFQYYCVPHSLHKALPSTTVYYKACAKSFRVVLCTTSFPHRHGDVSASKPPRFCSFPQRHGDARGQAETKVAASP